MPRGSSQRATCVLLTMALLAGCAAGCASEEHIIYIIRRQPAPARPAAAGVADKASGCTEPGGACVLPVARGSVYERFWHDPEQFYVDSPEGPVPLWGADLVYDKDGNPVPRYPDPYTKRLIENPDDADAYRQYLAWRMVLLRRARITGDRLREKAAEFGVLHPDVYKLPMGDHEQSLAVAKTDKVDPTGLGTPALTAEQAHELGLKPGEIPRTPGAPNDLEAIWIWDKDCTHCEVMGKEWWHFARDVTNAGYKAVSVTTNEDTGAVVAKLKFLSIRTPVFASLNLWDQTGLVKTMRVTATPTTIMLNRKTGKIVRQEGEMSEEALRGMFNKLAGFAADSWPPTPNAAAAAEAEGLRLELEARDRASAAAPAAEASAGTTAPGSTSTPLRRRQTDQGE